MMKSRSRSWSGCASYTGFSFPLDKFFRPGSRKGRILSCRPGSSPSKDLWGVSRPSGTWDFSTNGTYWAGKANIPSIGFGPGNEVDAHTIGEHVPLQDVVDAAAFYALLPKEPERHYRLLQAVRGHEISRTLRMGPGLDRLQQHTRSAGGRVARWRGG